MSYDPFGFEIPSRPDSIRLIVRGYGDGVKVFEEHLVLEEADLAQMAEDHLQVLLKYERHMVEFEFPDAPEYERFMRFGTDPRRMVLPMAVRL